MSRSYAAGVQREGEFQNTPHSRSATEERQQSAAALHLADCSDKPTGEKHSHSGGRRGATAEVVEEGVKKAKHTADKWIRGRRKRKRSATPTDALFLVCPL